VCGIYRHLLGCAETFNSPASDPLKKRIKVLSWNPESRSFFIERVPKWEPAAQIHNAQSARFLQILTAMPEPLGSVPYETPLSLQPVPVRAASGTAAAVFVVMLMVFAALGTAFMLLQ
jgi:hypothetical protein